MAETPQFSVRCPPGLLARIDQLVTTRRADLRAAAGTFNTPRTTRTDVIVELLEEAIRARDAVSPKPVRPAKPTKRAALVRPKRKR